MARKDALKKIKEELLERREALRDAVAGDGKKLIELSEQAGGDIVDFASESAVGELNSQLAEVASRELVNVEIALKRIAANQYGKCEACNSTIPLPRLQALPYATYCIECQRDLEKYQRHGRAVADWSRILERSGPDATVGDLDFNIS